VRDGLGVDITVLVRVVWFGCLAAGAVEGSGAPSFFFPVLFFLLFGAIREVYRSTKDLEDTYADNKGSQWSRALLVREVEGMGSGWMRWWRARYITTADHMHECLSIGRKGRRNVRIMDDGFVD